MVARGYSATSPRLSPSTFASPPIRSLGALARDEGLDARTTTDLPGRGTIGSPRIRLHDLRHSHATHLLAAGTNVRVTSERLSHAPVAFTLDVYGHVLPGQQADAAAAVAALVDG